LNELLALPRQFERSFNFVGVLLLMFSSTRLASNSASCRSPWRHVRFTPESGHQVGQPACPFWDPMQTHWCEPSNHPAAVERSRGGGMCSQVRTSQSDCRAVRNWARKRQLVHTSKREARIRATGPTIFGPMEPQALCDLCSNGKHGVIKLCQRKGKCHVR
jgi:hypothetical protein